MKKIMFAFFFVQQLFAQDTLDQIPLSVSFAEEVVVTGQYTPTDIQAATLPVKVITKEMIERRAATSLAEVFQQESSIRIQQDAVLGTSLTMNGLRGKYVKILINSVPMIGRNDGNLDLDRIQVQDIERIEIIENAMSVTYGTNALGGTINIITKKTKDEPWNARFMGQVQSNQQYNAALALGAAWKGFGLDLNYNFSLFKGFSTDTLRSQAWNPKTQHSFGAKLYYNIPKTSIRLDYQFSYLYEKIDNKGIVKLQNFPSLSYAKDYEFITQTQEHSLTALGYLDKKKQYYLDVLLAFNHYHREKNAYFRSLNENNSPDTLDKNDGDTSAFQAWNLRAMLASQYHKKIDFQVGLDFRYDYTAGKRIDQGEAVIGDFAAFANLKWRLFSKLYIDAGLRLAYHTRISFPFTYSAGVNWKITDGMKLQASYARGIRSPSLKELYLNFVDVNHYIKGNPNLKPEYAHNLRMTWTYNKAYFGEHIVNLSLGAFYNYIEQQITLFGYTLDSLGQYTTASNSNQYAYFNLEEYQNWGLDSKFKYQYKGLSIRFGVVLIGHYNALNRTYSEEVNPFQYTLEFSQEISYHFKKIDLTLSLFRRDYDKQISYTAVENPQTQTVEIFQNTMDGYGLMDVSISKRFWKNGMSLSIGVKNLLDVVNVNQTASSSIHNKVGPQSVGMGRIYFVKLVCQPIQIVQSNFKRKI